MIGRTDLLAQVSRGGEHLDDLDLNPLLVQGGARAEQALQRRSSGRNEVPDTLDAQIVRDAAALLERGEKMQLTYTVRNTMRAIGARTSSAIIVRKYGMEAAAARPPDRPAARARPARAWAPSPCRACASN